ncbi:MAG: dockerin type I domain-containing protein [Porcipelethomonas sp.]
MKIRSKILSAFIAGMTVLTSVSGGVYCGSGNTYMTVSGAESSVRGDANGDGQMNIRDAANIAKAISQSSTGSLPETADFNGDGTVNVRDAASIANTMSIRIYLTDTAFYDVNDDGKIDMIEVYDFSKSFYYRNYWGRMRMRVYYTNGYIKDYHSYDYAEGINSVCIIYDKNIDKIYTIFALRGGGAVYPTFYIENEEMNILVQGTADYSNPYSAEYEYTINGETASKEEFLNYMRNIEIIYPLTDYNIIEEGIKNVETYWN